MHAGRLVELIVVGGMSGMAAMFAASSASADSFDTRYPVCMKVFASGGVRWDCYFSSIEQCWAYTDGMAALCEPNRNYVPAMAGAPPARRGF